MARRGGGVTGRTIAEMVGELTFIDPGTYAADRPGICANEERGNHGRRDGCGGEDADR
jgi:hypothetical protein